MVHQAGVLLHCCSYGLHSTYYISFYCNVLYILLPLSTTLGLRVHQHRTRLSQLQLISHPLTPGGWVGLSTPAQGCLQWTGENGTHYLSVWHSTVRTQHPLRQSSDHTNHLMALPTSAAMPQLQTWWKGLSSVWLLGRIHTETLVTSQICSNASLKDMSESWARQVHNIKIRPTLSTYQKCLHWKTAALVDC